MQRVARSTFLLFLMLLIAVPSLVFAQGAQVGTLSGTVRDQTGAVLPGVTVEAVSQERGFKKNTVTDMQGKFLFPQMPLGRYRVVVSLSGFETKTITDNVVEMEKTTDLDISLRLSAAAEEITITGETPVVDKTNTTVQTRLRNKEFEKLPVGRTYQALLGQAPGVVGIGNVFAHGALSSNNQFLFDGIDTTDPTTGTFGTNINFEAIQEMNIYTAGLSAEYGRSVGAVMNVVTKSGSNNLEGSAKWIATNDEWDADNKTHNEVTGASLNRTKFDQIQDVYAVTLGGPIMRDRAWFFGTYDEASTTTPQRQTLGVGENYQQTTVREFWAGKLNAQLSENHAVWVRYHDSPTNGFIVDYWGRSGELEALTSQDQGADSLGGQWTGIFGSSFTMEATYAENDEFILVHPYQVSGFQGGTAHWSEADNNWYNGATFDGIVDRPREQALVAGSYYATLGGNSHQFKAGLDYQELHSGARFAYPNNTIFEDKSFDPVTRTFVPDVRRDYDPPVDSTSNSEILSLYARDKFEIGTQWFVEIGLRFEQQEGSSDIGELTVDTSTVSPRFSVSYDVTGQGRSIVAATGGRIYQYVLQGFSDAFANIPQQTNHDVFVWDPNTNSFEFAERISAAQSGFHPNSDVDPSYVDEFTIGFDQQIGNMIGVGIRGIFREWGDIIDDIRDFNPDGTQFRQVVNYAPAERKYTAVELTFDKRFANRWYANANYTWSKAEGNHFANDFTSLGNWLSRTCRTTVDPTIGTGGTIPCREVQEGANTFGLAFYDRPHSVKALAAYSYPIGPVNLTAGLGANWISGPNYTRNRSVNVLSPSGANVATATYFYEQRGSNEVDSFWSSDISLEATYSIFRTVEFGFKGEVFNVTDEQDRTTVNNTLWCNNTTNPSATCSTNRNQFGTATARGSFQTPRQFRITALVRF